MSAFDVYFAEQLSQQAWDDYHRQQIWDAYRLQQAWDAYWDQHYRPH